MFDKSGLMQLQIWIEIWPMGGRVPALPGCEVQTRNQRWWGGGDNGDASKHTGCRRGSSSSSVPVLSANMNHLLLLLLLQAAASRSFVTKSFVDLPRLRGAVVLLAVP